MHQKSMLGNISENINKMKSKKYILKAPLDIKQVFPYRKL